MVRFSFFFVSFIYFLTANNWSQSPADSSNRPRFVPIGPAYRFPFAFVFCGFGAFFFFLLFFLFLASFFYGEVRHRA